MSAGRGKYAEGKVRDFLKQWAADHLHFCFNRILDAHSAKGAMANPQPGDFQWFMRTDLACACYSAPTRDKDLVDTAISDPVYTRNGLIEVKEVEHAFRLPHKNFSPDQVGRMRIRQLAGSEPLVLICHRPPERPVVWRAPEFEFFQQREGGGWDLREFEDHPWVSDFLKEYLS